MKKFILMAAVVSGCGLMSNSVLCMMSMKPRQKERAMALNIIDLNDSVVVYDCGVVEKRPEVSGNKKWERLEQEQLELARQRDAVKRGVAQEADEQRAALGSVGNVQSHWVFDINWRALGAENVAAAGKECVLCAALFAKDRGNAFEAAIGDGIQKFEELKGRGLANAHKVKQLSCYYQMCNDIMLKQCATIGITDKKAVEHSACLLTMMVQGLENANLLNDKFASQ